jgi:hypothetical protein
VSLGNRWCGPGLALPSRRTFAASTNPPVADRRPLASVHSVLAAFRHLGCACQHGRLHWQGQALAFALRCALPVMVVGHAAFAQPPSRLAQVPAVPMPEVEFVESAPPDAAIPARNTGPQAMARSRYRRGRHGTTRIIRRTPAVMREDAARVKRGDLFSTWSNEYLE